MLNVTHQLVGVSAALAAARLVGADPVETAVAATAAVAGSRLPDVDQPGARVHRRTSLERRSVAAGAFGAAARLPMLLVALGLRHRGVTHSLLACATVVAAAAWAATVGGALGGAVGAGVACGYLAHVVADACTPAGVGLLRPFSSKAVWLVPGWARVRTGSAREALVVGAALAVGAFAVM